MASLVADVEKRQLSWDYCYNVRDLGGLATAGGTMTKTQAVVRSDLLSRLTPVGWQALADYGVQTIIDLRGAAEAAASPYHQNLAPTLAYHNLPLEGDQPIQAETRLEVYRLTLSHCAPQIVGVMQQIAAAPPGAVLLHCHAGKDRTGIITALLLRLVGVDLATIGADYAASQAALWPLYDQIVAAAGGEAHVNPWLKPIATPDMILQPLAEIEQRFGSVASYLKQSRLSDIDIARLRRRLLQVG